VTRKPVVRSRRHLVQFLPRRRYSPFSGTTSLVELRTALQDLLGSGRDDGEALHEYEAEFARTAGCRYAFAFAAGRMALFAILEALDFDDGDEVLLPGYTCVVVANALRYRGLRPVFVDIDPHTFNLDPAAVASRLTSRTRALYLQHTFGVTAEVSGIRECAERHGLSVIEDASHSLGATGDGRRHGALGDVAFFSTDRTKVINTHLGGMVTTNDPALARRLGTLQSRTASLPSGLTRRILLSYLAEGALYEPHVLFAGRVVVSAMRRLGMLFEWTDETSLDRPTGYPYPALLAAPQARIGLLQLRSLERNLAHRRSVATWLEERVGLYGDTLKAAFTEQAWLRYAFLVNDREGFEARVRGVFDPSNWFDPVLHGAVGDLRSFGYEPGTCPTAEWVARRIVNIPTHPRIPIQALETLWRRHGDWIEAHVERP